MGNLKQKRIAKKVKATLRNLITTAWDVIKEKDRIGEITYSSFQKQYYKVATLEKALANEKEKLLFDVLNINLSSLTNTDKKLSSEGEKYIRLMKSEMRKIIHQKIKESNEKNNQFSSILNRNNKEEYEEHFYLVSEIIGTCLEKVSDLSETDIDYQSVMPCLLLDDGNEKPKPGYIFKDNKFRFVF